MMKAEVIAKTTDTPLSFIGSVAGISYGKSDPSSKRAKNCFNLGHMSVFEHVSVTWRIEGISRACSHQLVRHRLASYCQQSQRYTEVGTSTAEDGADWYVTPPEVEASDRTLIEYEVAMGTCADHYNSLLKKGIKPEDARYVLPESTKTSISVTMNLREFANFYELRADKHAQWEVRELAEEMRGELQLLGGEWKDFTELLHRD